ncbi:MAG: nitroreductase family protein [Pseudomonadota bacterium]
MKLAEILAARFGDTPEPAQGCEALAGMAGRGSCRRFAERPVPQDLIETLCAVALSAPTKSDLQQRDILIVTDTELRAKLDLACQTQAWLSGAPVLLVFLANHRRQRRLSALHGLDFVNHHADAPFNAAMDAAIAMGAFVTAAEAAGLGCCPVSAIRNRPDEVAELLSLPDLVFPAMALALGWPAAEPEIAMRLPLTANLHQNRFDDTGEEDVIRAYDAARTAHQPYASQRSAKAFGTSPNYGWSEDKARQYALPERAGFGAYLRRIGFSLD